MCIVYRYFYVFIFNMWYEVEFDLEEDKMVFGKSNGGSIGIVRLS